MEGLRKPHLSEQAKNWSAVLLAVGVAVSALIWGIRLRVAEVSKADYESKIAEIDAKKKAKPILHVIPEVKPLGSSHDVRRLQIDVRFENAGHIDVSIDEVRIDVYRGHANSKAADIISRTQRISNLFRQLEPFVTPSDTQSDQNTLREDKREELQAVWDEFQREHANCPHGNIFLISEDSSSITWSETPVLQETRPTSQVLHPSQSSFDTFTFLITDLLDIHFHWFRFDLTVNSGKPTEQVRQFVIPAFRSDSFGSYFPTTTASARTTTQTVWKPDTNLLPRRSESGKSETTDQGGDED